MKKFKILSNDYDGTSQLLDITKEKKGVKYPFFYCYLDIKLPQGTLISGELEFPPSLSVTNKRLPNFYVKKYRRDNKWIQL